MHTLMRVVHIYVCITLPPCFNTQLTRRLLISAVILSDPCPADTVQGGEQTHNNKGPESGSTWVDLYNYSTIAKHCMLFRRALTDNSGRCNNSEKTSGSCAVNTKDAVVKLLMANNKINIYVLAYARGCGKFTKC